MQNELREDPIKIFGFEASGSLLKGIFAGGLSLLSVAIGFTYSFFKS